ncbi:MAG: hypothetical protein E7558_02315 [Ruminococcaceae bacterium]|nr:hypothetical protein [Oscillospiraceae bacterium]
MDRVSGKPPFQWFSGAYVYAVPDMNEGWFAIMILWSCLFALKTFGFLSKKKDCNVYLSLGISRNKLFYSKYLGGAVGIFGTIGAYYALDLLSHWLENGLMIEGFTVWAFYFISTLVTCLAAYTVAVYAFVNAGNIVEGIVFTFFFGIFWPAFNVTLNQAMSVLVYGNAHGTRLYAASKFFSSDVWYLDIFGSYTEQLTFYTRDLTKVNVSYNGFTTPDWSGVIFAVFVIIVITYISGRMFRKRTSEICGFVFRSKNLYKTFFMLLGICMGLSLMAAFPMHKIAAAATSVLIALIFVFVGWLICDRKVPVKATVALAVLSVVFVGGCLIGYGDDVPEKSKVKAVDIATDFSYLQDADPCQYSRLSSFGSVSPSYLGKTSVGVSRYYSDNYYYVTLTTDKDIDWVLDLHSNLINDGYRWYPDENTARGEITISYLMDDGSVIVRNYDYMSIETYKKLLGFDKTEKGSALLNYALTSDDSIKLINRNVGPVNSVEGSNHYYFGFFGYSEYVENVASIMMNDPVSHYYGFGEASTVAVLADKDLSYVGMIEKAEKSLWVNEFFNALFTDIKNQTVEQKHFHSAEDEIGAVLVPLNANSEIVPYSIILEDYEKLEKSDAFYGNFHAYYEKRMDEYYQEEDEYYDDYEYEEYSDVEYYPTVEADPDYEKDPERIVGNIVKKGNSGEFFYTYVITKDMTDTIEYLKKIGLYDELMKAEEQPVSVNIDKAEVVLEPFYTPDDKIQTMAINPNFSTYDYEAYSEYMVDIFTSAPITDSAVIAEVYSKSQMYSGKVYGGYIAEFFYADGKQVSRFVPASAMTDELLAKMNVAD